MSFNNVLTTPSSTQKNSSNKPKIIVGLILLGLLAFSGVSYAANISLGSGNVEFGQGTTTATACDADVVVSSKSKVVNSMFFLDTITVSNIDKAACNGKDLSVYLNLDIGGQDMLGVAKFTMDGAGSSLEPASGTLTFVAGGQEVTPPSNAVAVTSGACTSDGCSVVLSYTNIPSSALKKILLETSQ